MSFNKITVRCPICNKEILGDDLDLLTYLAELHLLYSHTVIEIEKLAKKQNQRLEVR